MKGLEQTSQVQRLSGGRLALNSSINNQNIKNNGNTLPADRDKMSIKKPLDITKLYARQFFQHFFHQKSIFQSLSSITSVSNFEKSIGFENSKTLAKNKLAVGAGGGGGNRNIIERQGKQITQFLQDLYHRLQIIFDQWNHNIERQFDSPALFKESVNDDELYEMLNDYKQQNKKLKELKRKNQGQIGQLKKQLNRLEDDKIRICQQSKQKQMEISLLNKTICELNEKMKGLDEQIQTLIFQKEGLNQKITLLFEINQNLSASDKIKIQLESKLNASLQRQAMLSKKFQALDSIIKCRIKERDDKWQAMIENKLTSKAIFQKPAIAAFRQFMTSLQSQSKP